MESRAAVSEIPQHTGPGRELILGTSITLLSLSCLEDKENYDWAVSEEILELDGPMPRLFKDKMIDGIDRWREARDGAIQTQTYAKLRSVLEATSKTHADAPRDIGALSHKLFLIRRKNLEEFHDGKAVISIITPHVENKLAKKLIQLEKDQLLDLYRIASGAPFTRRVAGVFYEVYCLKYLMEEDTDLELLKMVRLPGPASKKRQRDSESAYKSKQSRKKYEHRFYSSHQAIENAKLEEERKNFA
jgi:hypothetical protein